MNKYLIMILLVATGCGAHIDKSDVEIMATICAKNDGLKYAILTNVSDGNDEFVCNDGASFIHKSHEVVQ